MTATEFCKHVRVDALIKVAERGPFNRGVGVGAGALQDKVLVVKKVCGILAIIRHGLEAIKGAKGS